MDTPLNPVMGKLTSAEKKELPESAFALPGRRYPIPDANHARAALARAEEMKRKGLLSDADYATVKRKAEKVLRDSKPKE